MTFAALLSHRMLLAAGLVALVTAAPAQADLIVNGGAEADVGSGSNYADIDVTGFAPETGAFTAVRYGSGSFPSVATSAQIGGGANFFTGGASAVATGEQRIDVSSLAAVIDAGRAAYTLSGHLGGFSSQADDAKVEAHFLGSGDAVLSTAVIGPVTAAERANATTLLPRVSTGTTPTGTRAVRVVITTTRVSGTSNDGYADNISFTIAPSTAVQTPVALPSTRRPTVIRSPAVGTLSNGGRTVTVTPSTACLLTATTKFRVPAGPAIGGARQNAAVSRLVSAYRIPGARVTVPPVRITTLVPRLPVKIPVVPVTTRVPAPGVPRVVDPPRVPTVSTVTCRPLAGVVHAPPTASPAGVEYIRISNPGMVFDSDRSVIGSADALRRLGGNAYCQLRFTFSARPGGSTATGTAAFTYTD